MRVWLKRRPSVAPAIAGWVGDVAATYGHWVFRIWCSIPRRPAGLALAKVAMVADAILIPVSGPVFDREAASDCWAELRAPARSEWSLSGCRNWHAAGSPDASRRNR